MVTANLKARDAGNGGYRQGDTYGSILASSTRKDLERILGNQQVTDSYLLTLAARNRARLLTFDTRLAAFAQSEGSVEVLTDG